MGGTPWEDAQDTPKLWQREHLLSLLLPQDLGGHSRHREGAWGPPCAGTVIYPCSPVSGVWPRAKWMEDLLR